ncbi:hypothetical protein SEA_WALELIANO_49 [Mycobacterium phage Waleliano]|uniref:Uncharacterized protein n=4 Tax=Coopervirus TaxID=1982898 RepID=A0A345KWL1_9CAUD|nr:hypothetical protein AVV09_gp51 [Mycobacterium phage BrownCNA]YP_009614473.1 hypothetical protein FDI64_gp50 [Mycobacterium phage Zemanar]AXH47413.1 hypothetical protein SEA_HANGMAN_49 [Mycobacterium phage Hangman]QBI96118.1 hypothetical protein SEA_WALELIANO_49 [Mycobacterium phage Waleliano]AEJ95724.1 hypothetical protein ZEMANAR_50 [Mycobacterium phage Zemanar]AKY02764.1 hypothetical protein SEA_BROWNCNA_51 [Mycobacterium phage BrownCNA]
MSVSFNRAALIKAAKTALANHDKAQASYAQAVRDYRDNHRGEWSPQQMGALRDWLSKQLRKGGAAPTVADARKAVGVTDVEYVFYSPPADYDVRKAVTQPKALLSPVQINETRALLEVLNAATGDVVSANELKLLGLTKLAHVFQAAAGEVAS